MQWPYFVEVQPPDPGPAPWVDVILEPLVFDKARFDLQDLRLYTTGGQEIPYALRIRAEKFEKEPFASDAFNLTQGPDGASEMTLDLHQSGLEHNEIEVQLPGTNYRRKAQLEGSDDGNTWRPVHEQYLISFERGERKLRDETISYAPSRYRFVRLRIFPDPEVDKEPLTIGKVAVLRRVEIPGEALTLPAQLGAREPVRVDREPGSAWMLTLGGDQTPVTRLEVNVADTDFVRDYRIEVGGPADLGRPFALVASGVWQRKAGEQIKPLIAEFGEIRGARLRLLVKDSRNPPLQIQGVQYSAAARQVVFAAPQGRAPLQLYFGNPKAGATAYDFARNLPEKLVPEPVRAKSGPRRDNPEYVAEPLPLTERWPWLIYVVMGAVIAVLAAILISLSRAAIRAHDSLALSQASPASGGDAP